MNYALVGDMTNSKEFELLKTKLKLTAKTDFQIAAEIDSFNTDMSIKYVKVIQHISDIVYDKNPVLLSKAEFSIKSTVSIINGVMNCPWIPIQRIPSNYELEQIKAIAGTFHIVTVDLSTSEAVLEIN